MPYSLQVMQDRFNVGTEKMQAWLSAPDGFLDQFMTAENCLAIELKKVTNEDAPTSIYLDQFTEQKKELARRSSPSRKRSTRTNMADCIGLAQTELEQLISLALVSETNTNTSSLIERANALLKNCKQAKLEKSSALQMTEFFEKNETYIANMVVLKSLLDGMLKENIFGESEVSQVTDYVTRIDALLSAYQEVDLMGAIKDSSALTMVALNGKINTAEFSRYADTIIDLGLNQENFDLLSAKYKIQISEFVKERPGLVIGKFNSLESYTLMPIQHLMRFPLLFGDIRGKLEKEAHFHQSGKNEILSLAATSADAAALKTKAITTKFNQIVGARVIYERLEKRMAEESPDIGKASLLNAILELNLHNQLQQQITPIAVDFFNRHLKTAVEEMLIQSPKKRLDILGALGVTDLSQPIFNVTQYSVTKLDILYKTDKNPLWLVLKSTIPVSESFSAEDKINTYIELAVIFRDKKMGNKDKYLGALSMAKSAYVVKNLLLADKEFGDWIVYKYGVHDKDKVQPKKKLSIEEIRTLLIAEDLVSSTSSIDHMDTTESSDSDVSTLVATTVSTDSSSSSDDESDESIRVDLSITPAGQQFEAGKVTSKMPSSLDAIFTGLNNGQITHLDIQIADEGSQPKRYLIDIVLLMKSTKEERIESLNLIMGAAQESSFITIGIAKMNDAPTSLLALSGRAEPLDLAMTSISQSKSITLDNVVELFSDLARLAQSDRRFNLNQFYVDSHASLIVAQEEIQGTLKIERAIQSPKINPLVQPTVGSNFSTHSEIPKHPEPVLKKTRHYLLIGLTGLGLGLGISLKMTGIFVPLGSGLISIVITGAVFAAVGAGLAALFNYGYKKIKGRSVEKEVDSAPLTSIVLKGSSHEQLNRLMGAKKRSLSLNGDDPGNASKAPFTTLKIEVAEATPPVHEARLKSTQNSAG